jgi:hypothetical protein
MVIDPVSVRPLQQTADFGAGTGQLSRALPPGALCIETSKARFREGTSSGNIQSERG